MTLNPEFLQTATDSVVFSSYLNLRSQNLWKIGLDTADPDYAGLTAEPVVLSDAFALDAFRIPTTEPIDHYPGLMVPTFNPKSTGVIAFEGKINTDAVKAEYAVFTEAAQADYVLSIVPLVYKQIPILSTQLLSRGYGFRKFYPSRLVDADTDGPFGLDVNGAALGAYVQVILGDPIVVTRVNLWMSGAGSAAEFQIQGSNEGGTWVNLLASEDLFAPTLSGLNTKTFVNSLSFKRYRLVLAGGAGVHTVKVYEMAFYSIPQVVVVSTDVPIASSEVTSMMFLNNQSVDWGVEDYLQATYTFAVPLDLGATGLNLMYIWVKSNTAGSMVGALTFTSTDASTVDAIVQVDEVDTWTRIWVNLNPLVLTAGVNKLVSFNFNVSTEQGLEVTLGAMTTGETLVCATRNFGNEEYIPFHADSASAYLFFTSTALFPTLETDFKVTATPEPAGPLTPPEFDGTLVRIATVGVVADADDALARSTLYAAKFSLAAELNGNYYFMFGAPTSLTGLNILGWAVCREKHPVIIND